MEEGIIHDFSKNTKKNYWFGLRSYPQVSTLFLLKCLAMSSKDSARSYIRTLGVSMSSQESARSYIRTLGVSMSSQDSARSYIRTLGVSM